uniref:Uncharacterized protein n=1 Tax=Magallana gigas TaxID=29159 RepID=A0A8W8NG85_MAGGI
MRKFGFGTHNLQGQIMEEVDCLMEKMFASTNPSSPVFIFPTLHHLPMSSFGQMEKSFKEIDEFYLGDDSRPQTKIC